MVSLLSEHWLELSLAAVFFYGISDGLYKQFLEEISVPRFCLYSVPVTAVVYMSYFLTQEHPPPFAPEGREFFYYAMLSGTLEGIAGVLSFEAMASGPVSIIGPVTAAYPAVTVILAFFFLQELLIPAQYMGIALVVVACLAIAYEPSTPTGKAARRFLGMPLWFVQAILAAMLWGIGGAMDSWVYSLPNANEANFMLFGVFTEVLTTGLYGLFLERKWIFSIKEWACAAMPVTLGGIADMALYIAYIKGSASLVTTLGSAYPSVTLVYAFFVLKERLTRFHWVCIVLVFAGVLSCVWR
jgi:drug/metabolite transporter (DMT)-like permease